MNMIKILVYISRKMFSSVVGEDFTQHGCQSVKPTFHLLYFVGEFLIVKGVEFYLHALWSC